MTLGPRIMQQVNRRSGRGGHLSQGHTYLFVLTNVQMKKKPISLCHDGRGAITVFFSLLYRAELLAWEKRLLGFGACLLGAVACFFVAFISLSLRPSKFALAFRCVFLP